MSLAGISIGIVTVVAIISAVLAIVTLVGWRRSGNWKIGFVAAAFLTHFVKSTLVVIFLSLDLFGHDVVEAVEAIFDLVMIVCLFIPFVARS